jgi:hypothetical protein
MRLAQVGLGSGGGPSGLPFLGPTSVTRSASNLPRHERQMTTATQTPGEIQKFGKAVLQKNPSDATNKGKIANPNAITNTGSRKHVVLLGSFLFRLPIAAEGRFKGHFANSPRK